jgi:hypothetical protein
LLLTGEVKFLNNGAAGKPSPNRANLVSGGRRETL